MLTKLLRVYSIFAARNVVPSILKTAIFVNTPSSIFIYMAIAEMSFGINMVQLTEVVSVLTLRALTI